MIAIDTSDVEIAVRYVEGVAERIQDPGPLLDHVAPGLLGAVITNVDERTGPDGAFPPLSARYAAWKQRTHPGKPMLHLDEVLVPSFRARAIPSEAAVEVGPTGAAEYAGPALAARDPLWLRDADVDRLAAQAQSYFETGGFGGAR